MATLPPKTENDMQLRLRRIEGQIRGIINMLGEGKSCEQVVTQILAARAAMDRVATEVLKCQVTEALGDDATPESREAVLRAIDLLNRVQ
ncbi:MAG TPA: metal-sensitive transcriptional regulator [Ktedonobacterales bacterium]|nr:metal-sensitive transcriptional regulator [Ktedonobacterales bacterium]